MGWFRKKKDEGAVATADGPGCPHVALVPRWDNVDDIGKADMATSFSCEGCNEEFTPEQARELRMTEAARLAERLN
jgi:hypothetical protein